MTNRKQSAVSRRQSNRLSGDTNLSLTSINNNLNSFIQSTNFNINSITNNLNQTTQVSSNTTLNLDYQLNVTNVGSLAYTANDHEIRILALEAAGPGGGGGGIDPTDPTQPILLWDNFINQSNGDESGTASPYSFFGLPAPTSSQLLTPNELEVYEADSETDHLGIVEVRLPVASVVGRLSLVNTSTIDSFSFDNFNVVYFIIKTTNPSDNYNIKLGLFDDISSHTEGIFFNGTKGGSWVPTVTDGTAVTGATTALANSTWYTLRIEKKSATSVGFKINNGAEVVISTNIPTGFLTCGILFENTTGTPTQDISFNIDFFSLKLKDTGTLSSEYTVVGTTNEVEVTTVGTTITVGLPSAITVDTVNTDEIFLDPTVTPPESVTAGHLIYDSTYDTAVLGMNGSVNVPIGQALFKQVHNNTGSIINKGDVVYVSGSHGTTILQVAKAQANSEATSTPTIGLAAENIAHGTDGFIITQGLLTGLDTNIYSAGQTIYLSDSVPGGWRTTFPDAPLHGTFVGWIVKSAGSGAGSIYVKIQNYNEISELSDVYIPSTPSNNDVLQWDGMDARWENRSLATAGIAETGHTHSLTDITQSSANKYEVPQWNGTNWVAYDTRLPENRIIVVSEMNAAGNWTVFSSGTGTSNSFTTAGLLFDDKFGILTSGTGSTAAGRAGISSAVLDGVVFGTHVVEFECIVRIPTLSDATNTFIVNAGFSDNQAGVAVDGLHFQYSDTVNSGKWVCLRYNNNASASVDSGITVVAGTWYKLKIIVSTTEANFYIDNTLVGTLNTIPTGTTRATGVFTGIRKTFGTTARTINIDYMHYTQETTR